MVPPSVTVANAIAQFARYSPSDVADALQKHGFPHGGFLPNLTQFSFRYSSGQFSLGSSSSPASSSPSPATSTPGSTVGFAYTVTYAPLDDPRPALLASYIDAVPAGAVVAIGLARGAQLPYAPYVTVNSALYGGLMLTRAQYLRARGTVVFGRIRDVLEHRALGYPVWAYGTGIAAHKGVVKLVAINEPLEVLIGMSLSASEGEVVSKKNRGELWEVVSPGDILVADENGVARVPVQDEALLEKVVSYVPKRVRADELVAKDIKSGKEAKKSQKYRRENL